MQCLLIVSDFDDIRRIEVQGQSATNSMMILTFSSTQLFVDIESWLNTPLETETIECGSVARSFECRNQKRHLFNLCVAGNGDFYSNQSAFAPRFILWL